MKNLPEDAVLFVFGDHGMTDGGEHGGASLEETDSALFIYSPVPIFEVQCVSNGHNILYCGVHNCDMTFIRRIQNHCGRVNPNLQIAIIAVSGIGTK